MWITFKTWLIFNDRQFMPGKGYASLLKNESLYFTYRCGNCLRKGTRYFLLSGWVGAICKNTSSEWHELFLYKNIWCAFIHTKLIKQIWFNLVATWGKNGRMLVLPFSYDISPGLPRGCSTSLLWAWCVRI